MRNLWQLFLDSEAPIIVRKLAAVTLVMTAITVICLLYIGTVLLFITLLGEVWGVILMVILFITIPISVMVWKSIK